MKRSRMEAWAEAKRRCRLSDEALAMAKELGMGPRSLIKNLPAPREGWKAPVETWVRDLHAKRFGNRPPPTAGPAVEPARTAPAAVPEFCERAPDPSPENKLEAAQQALMESLEGQSVDPEEFSETFDDLERSIPVSQGEVEDDNRRLLRRRDSFRRFVELFAGIASQLDFVQRIALFGSVAAPLQKEIPRFARLRRARIAVWHECKDVDLAIWVSDLVRLRELKRALSDAVNQWQQIARRETLPGIPHHQVDVFVMEPGTDRYRGNLCHFGQCPKGKPECEVAGCGAQPFLRLYDDFPFDRSAVFGPHAAILFQRAPEAAATEDTDIPF